jgi:hypothetical protein
MTVDWPHWARVALAILIAVIVAIGLLLFLPDTADDNESESGGFKMASEESRSYTLAQAAPQQSKYDRQLLDIERQAIDDAYHEQIKRLYLIWLKDESGQPTRATTGARQARAAYLRIMEAFERRERELTPKPQ